MINKNYRRILVGPTPFIVEVVDSYVDVERGLGGRGRLPRGSGMFFLYPRLGRYSFWMKDMQFPIDIIGFSDDGVVNGIIRNVQPELDVPLRRMKYYNMPKPISAALEINANESAAIKIGDYLEIEGMEHESSY